MASRALPGRAAVSHHTSAVDLLVVGMTEFARNLIVGASEGKRAGGLVIEEAGGPAYGVVTKSAIDRLRPFLELPGVNILVAADATFRRGLEGNGPVACRCSGRPVAIDASQRLVTTHQRKRRVPVIE